MTEVSFSLKEGLTVSDISLQWIEKTDFGFLAQIEWFVYGTHSGSASRIQEYHSVSISSQVCTLIFQFPYRLLEHGKVVKIGIFLVDLLDKIQLNS